MSDRLEAVRERIDEIVHGQPEATEKRCGFVHLYGVAAWCVLLARRRGMNAELAGVAGMLHDIWAYKVSPENHAALGAVEAGSILGQVGSFTREEMEAIGQAIGHHSAKAEVHAPLDELLKDADVIQHYLYNPAKGAGLADHPRVRRVLAELGVPVNG